MTNPLSEQTIPETLTGIEPTKQKPKTKEQPSQEKVLNVTNAEDSKNKVSDVEIYGNPDLFVCISKASSKTGGWMKSTKVMEIEGGGCVVQVTTQQGDKVAEALTFVPETMLSKDNSGNYKLVPFRRRNYV